MKDTELYRTILGLRSPWYIERVELKLQQEEVHVWVEHEEHSWRCPECDRVSSLYDHSEPRAWRHLDTMQYTTLIHGRVPRVSCDEHGVRQVRLPWAEERSRFTLLFERFAIDVLSQTHVSAACRILGLSWDEAWAIKERAVERGLARKKPAVPSGIGIDEKAFAKGHSYMSLICDLEGTIEWVAEERTAESIAPYFEQFAAEELNNLEAIAMDMWRAYARAVYDHVPEAADKIVYDRFHVMQELVEALDQVRKKEHRQLMANNDETLKGSKYLWLRSGVPHRDRLRFAALKHVDLKTGRAWSIKESLRRLWNLTTRAGADRYFQRWYFWATHSKLPPIIQAARKLKRHSREILNYFSHRVTNAISESLNAQIEKIKRMAHGFRNRKHFKIAILFHCGGLDLYPGTH